jgi:hypothetical protein
LLISQTWSLAMSPIFRALAATVTATAAASASAQDLFQVQVTPDDPSVMGVTAGSSSLLDLTESLLDTTGAFAPLAGEDFGASLRYAGVDDAIRFRLENNGTRAELTFPTLGETYIFDATDGDVEDQIEDFFKTDGGKTIAAFLKDMNRRSVVAVTDGNPLATTARNARYKFDRFGLHYDMTLREKRIARGEPAMGLWRQPEQTGGAGGAGEGQSETPGPAPQSGRSSQGWIVSGSEDGMRVRLDGRVAMLDTDAGDGSSATLAASGEMRFNRHVGVALSLPLSYHEVEGADVINAGLHLDVPIAFIVPQEPDGLTWQLTPGALVAGSASIDMVAGGTFWGLGATNLLAYEYRGWSFSFATQFTHYESIELSVDDYDFDPDLSQDVLINGGRVTAPIGDNAYAYAGLAYTKFLEDAAVEDYYTPMIGVGYRTGGGFDFRLGYEGDFGDGYEAHGVRVGLAMPF